MTASMIDHFNSYFVCLPVLCFLFAFVYSASAAVFLVMKWN